MLGNLTSVTLPGGNVITYNADAFGRRVWRELNGTITSKYVWGGDRIYAELDSSSQYKARFIYGTKAHVPDYMIAGGLIYRIVTDHIGSVRLVVKASDGTIAQAIQYDDLGNVISDTSPGFQPFGFAGGLYDSDTRLIRFGARDYDPETGRWTSKDPVLFQGGDTNLYGYVMSDPINYIDPTGLWRWPWTIKNDAERDAENSGLPGAHNGPQDAYRHCLASCVSSQENGTALTFLTGQGNEVRGTMGGQSESERGMDTDNNAIGCYLGKKPGSCSDKCMKALAGGVLTTTPRSGGRYN